MPVWVQLKAPKCIELRGRNEQLQAGDWVHVGKQMARQWIGDGTAFSPLPEATTVEYGAGTVGLMMFGKADAPALGIDCSLDGTYDLRWDLTCFWHVEAPVNAGLMSTGYTFLDRWQMAVPLWDYRVLCRHEVTDKERDYTESIIRDLRVPLYDTRLMFVRRTPETRALLELWELEGPGRVAFLRALYKVKPLILALPPTWTGQWAPTRA